MNLIICTTPLQVLIAEKIIDMYDKEEFLGVMLVPILNDKYKYYSALLKNKCSEFYVFLYPELSIRGIFFRLRNIYKLKFIIYAIKFERIFLANIDNVFLHILLDSFPNSQIFTFDDGTANIIEESNFKVECMSFKENIFRHIFFIRTSKRDLLMRSTLHYSIYENMRNIIDNVEYIKIFDDLNFVRNVNMDKKKVNILLGQPVFRDDEINVELAERIVDLFDINYYFPHPRERYVIKNAHYINTHLIFEDFLAKEMLNYNMNIYTLCSSSVIGLIGNPNINIYSIFDSRIESEKVSLVYNLFRRLNIKIFEI